MVKCKGCGKENETRWCRACYYEYHESKADLARDNSDDYEYEKEYDED